jgi:hypothetical protein
MAETKKIQMNRYVYFNCEDGRFYLTQRAQEMIYHEKNLICSYSGSDEWCNHFTCEMIDFCSGASVYNYSLGTVKHEKEIPEILEQNREELIKWIEHSREMPWGKKCYDLIERIIEEAEPEQ